MILAASTAAAQTPPPSPEERVKTADELKRESVQGAATAPLRDLNVVRAKIPRVLLEAMADPYARPPKGYNCRALIALVRPLDDALGPDLDRIAVEDQDVMDRSKETALGVAADLASDAIPFRGWVRKLTGAERHDRLVRDAIFSGGVRRAYLKGLGEAKGCNPPATPSHEKAGTPPPDPTRRFVPRFPTRAPDGPQSPAGTPPSAPRR
ncbi:hypothetical protein [Phenylobacterium sp.]|uniref:hypothetical protein n=1 Tax=Phenylobacterium sp. TaxID=1871053 RepID=UPI0028110669|nr:hypothetical protein [Phenylobacterium sp.]